MLPAKKKAYPSYNTGDYGPGVDRTAGPLPAARTDGKQSVYVRLDLTHLRVRPREQPPPIIAEEDDVASLEREEEEFASGMRRKAMVFDAHDVDGDQKLDFGEFCALVREREGGEQTDEELMARFKALDADGSGEVDMNEYVRYALTDALARSTVRVVDLFKQWDEDGLGEIEKHEFRKAVKAMGFDFFANDAELDMVFDDFDADKSGTITYSELNEALRKMKLPPPKALRKDPPKPRAAQLAAKLDFKSDPRLSASENLKVCLANNRLAVRELLAFIDEDGNGVIDQKEFRKAVGALGIQASRKEIDAVFGERPRRLLPFLALFLPSPSPTLPHPHPSSLALFLPPSPSPSRPRPHPLALALTLPRLLPPLASPSSSPLPRPPSQLDLPRLRRPLSRAQASSMTITRARSRTASSRWRSSGRSSSMRAISRCARRRPCTPRCRGRCRTTCTSRSTRRSSRARAQASRGARASSPR